jgi:hypothetical protein
MDYALAVVVMLFLALLSLIFAACAFLAAPDCRAFLPYWAEERNLTLLRCRGPFLVVWLVSMNPRVIFWVDVVDRDRVLRSGWVSVEGKSWNWEFVAHSAEARWVFERDIPRPLISMARPVTHLMWDPWIDV